MKKYILFFFLIPLICLSQFKTYHRYYNFHYRPISGITFESETLSLLARMTTPTVARQTQINTLIKSLKDAGVWTKLDVLQIYAQDIQANALLNWVSSFYNAVNTGSTTFTADQGFTGNASSMYVSTGFIPATNGIQFTQNSASMGVYDRTGGTLTTAQYLVGYGVDPAAYFSTSTTNNIICRINSAVSGGSWTFYPGGAYTGFIELNRSTSTRIDGYLNGRGLANVDSVASTSSGLTIDSLHILKNGQTAGGYCAHQISAFYASSLLSAAEHLSFFSAIETYMDAIGTGVVPLDTLANQNAEGTGYDYGEIMAEVDTVYEDSTSRPLRGLQSIYLTNISSTLTHYFSYPSDTIWTFFRYRANDATPAGAVYILNLRIGTTQMARLLYNTNGRLTIYHGTSSNAGTTVLQDNTIYYIWLRHIVGTGSDGKLDLYLDTDNTIPASPEATLSNGTTTRRPNNYIFSGIASGSFIDQIMVIKNSMGDVEN